jgi:c-di-GMP-related signal transduction protein
MRCSPLLSQVQRKYISVSYGFIFWVSAAKKLALKEVSSVKYHATVLIPQNRVNNYCKILQIL